MAAGDRLPDGTYRILVASTVGTSTVLALDVQSAGDANGTNIRTWTANDTDAQIFTAFSQGGEQVLYGPAIGRAADIQRMVMADGTNVRMYDSHKWGTHSGMDVDSQTWDIYETGATVTYNGTACKVYKVLAHKDNRFCMEVKGTDPKADQNVQIYTESKAAAAAKEWAFLPLPTVTDGIYSLRSALSASACMSVAGGSTADGARAQIASFRSDANEMVFGVETVAQGYSFIQTAIRAGMFLNLTGGKVNDGNPLQFYGGAPGQNKDHPSTGPGKGDFANRWALQPQGAAVDVNGVTCPAFRIVPQASTKPLKCADVAGGSTRIGTQIRVYTRNDTPAQAFILVPAEAYDQSLGTPSKVAGRVGSVEGALIGLRAGGTCLPSWMCPGTLFSIRYRTRTRAAGADIGAWSAWRSVTTGSDGNSGWGAAWEPDFEDATGSSAHVGDKGVAFQLSPTGTDRVDVQFEVRRFSRSAGVLKMAAHGPAKAGTTVIAWKPAVTVTGVSIGADGAHVGYKSDLPRGSNRVRVQVDGVGTGSAEGVTPNGTVKLSSLSRMPEEGERLTARVWLWSVDGVGSSASAAVAASYNAGHGATLSPTFSLDGTHGKLSGYPDGAKFWLLVHRGHGSRLVEVDPACVLPPLNVAYQLLGTYRSGSSWATWRKTFPAVPCRSYLVTALDGSRELAVTVNEGSAPGFAPSYEPDTAEHTTTGRERPVVTRGKTVAAKWQLEGALIPPDLERQADDADWAAHAGTVVFRSPKGFWAQAAVTGASMDYGKTGWIPVSLSMTEVEV